MRLKYLLTVLVTISTFLFPAFANASDFSWSVNLNLRAQTDPYGYRYGLAQRFGLLESDVIVISNRVYEPADAYLIFRLAELSGHSPEDVLRVYYERRHYGWFDIAHFLGIRHDRHEFILLRERHDMRDVHYAYQHKHNERYEERHVPHIQYRYVVKPKREHVVVQKHYSPKLKKEEPPRSKTVVVVQQQAKPSPKSESHRVHQKHEPKRKEDRKDEVKREHR